MSFFSYPILKRQKIHNSRFYRYLRFATHIINQWSNASFVWFSVKTNWNPCFWRWNIFQSSVNLSKKIHHLLFVYSTFSSIHTTDTIGKFFNCNNVLLFPFWWCLKLFCFSGVESVVTGVIILMCFILVQFESRIY